MRRAALALAALALAGCETTAEKSARLEREAKHVKLAQAGLEITHPSKRVKVLDAAAVSGKEGGAVAVRVRNLSSRTLLGVPIAITVSDAGGRTLFRNDAPGLEAALVSLPSLAAHQTVSWVDDQVPAGAGALRVSARVGEAPAAPSPAPSLVVTGVQRAEEGESALRATLRNPSATAQSQVVVFAEAERGGHVVAAGRAVLREVPAHGSAPFQVFLIGDPRGAQLRFSAPATRVH